MGNPLFSRHRLHSFGQVHLPAAQPHLRHDVADLVRVQLLTIEAEEHVVHPVIHFL